MTFWSSFSQRWCCSGPELTNTVPFSNCKWNLTATIIAAIHCFSHKHILFLFTMNFLLTILFCYPLFVVNVLSLGSHSIWVISGWMAEVCFPSLRLDYFSKWPVTNRLGKAFQGNFKCCILWNTDICRTLLVWKYFKYPVTTLPMSNKEQQS